MRVSFFLSSVARLALTTSAAVVLPAGIADAQSQTIEAPDEAVARAEAARVKAERALQEATNALQEARQALAAARRAQLRAAPAAAELSGSGEDPCTSDQTDPDLVVNDPNLFQRCIGLGRWRDFPQSELNINLAATSETTIDVIPSYTRYYRSPFTDGEAFNWYWKVLGGVSVKLDSGKKSATFADLTKFEASRGIEYVGGLEIGFGPRRSRSDFLADARRGLLAARRACIAYYSSDPEADPLVLPAPGQPGSTHTVLRTPSDVVSKCTGTALTSWIAVDPERREIYYKSIVKPQWGYGKANSLYFGAEGRLSEPELSFFPLHDPASTGMPLIRTLPPNFPKDASNVTPTLFSVIGYAGTVLGNRVGLSASLSYGRRADFLKDYKDVSVCAPQQPEAAFLKCASINTAPPYVSEGWAIGGRAALAIGRFLFFPEMGLETKLSYRFDIDQFGIQVPFLTFLDDKGKTTAGVLLGCTTDGETANGFKIDGDCRASLFVGSSFKLAGRP